jgi:hypothetical protein
LPNGFRLTVPGFIDMYLLSPRSADTSFPYSEPPLNPIKQASSISVEVFLYLISTLKSTVYYKSSRVQLQGSRQEKAWIVFDTDFEGFGIGFAAVMRIINCHEGRIWAEGYVNRGSSYDPKVVDACLRFFNEKGYRL